ncbi:MAG TPA: hypothetical protein VKI01_08845 [Acidimicrobiia bacterium]|nr:hypothetical protein [Acidimicrobiia bacterium]
MSGRPDLDSFKAGAIYRHNRSGEAVEFVGIASMRELGGEDVAVFRFVERGGCLIATNRGYDRGETFRRVAEDRDVDEATTAEWRAFVEGDDS